MAKKIIYILLIVSTLGMVTLACQTNKIGLGDPSGRSMGLNLSIVQYSSSVDEIQVAEQAQEKPLNPEIAEFILQTSIQITMVEQVIEKSENQRVANKIIGHFMGRSCQIRCIYEPEDNHLLRAALKMGAQIIKTDEK